QTILDLADDALAYPSVPNWNGDDAVTLSKDGVVIDMFGVVGTDPGSSWVVGTGTTADHTLVRDPSVVSPVGTWNPAQWVVYPVDTFTYLGSHTIS
ncbi:MAG: DNA degradation protein EddB, partial [Firmicutes bacterium]|nr:DNA degradation protein EddB [Bacillota bacterium]